MNDKVARYHAVVLDNVERWLIIEEMLSIMPQITRLNARLDELKVKTRKWGDTVTQQEIELVVKIINRRKAKEAEMEKNKI